MRKTVFAKALTAVCASSIVALTVLRLNQWDFPIGRLTLGASAQLPSTTSEALLQNTAQGVPLTVEQLQSLPLDVKCTDVRTMGDGNYRREFLVGQLPYRICFDFPTRPNRGECIVYSFGIDGDWSFDDDFDHYGCEVFSFDPEESMEESPDTRGNHVYFFPVGLVGPQKEDEDYLTLRAIMARLNQTKEIIDVLKVNIETSEKEVFDDRATLELIASQVKQLTIEWHFEKTPETHHDMLAVRRNFKSITGFQTFYTEPRKCLWSPAIFLVESLVNPKFAPKNEQFSFSLTLPAPTMA